MSHSGTVGIVGGGALVLVLVAHLWMFDVPVHVAGHGDAVAAVSAAPAPDSVGGCPTDMAACRVAMPVDRVTALLLLAAFAVATLVAVTPGDAALDAASGRVAAGERDPPPRPVVPSSVVLLL